ncbi:anti-sigma factor [Altererythrobacter sp. C41]|uniref:anti-sigma factor n=1 Tax=Altererythrobacter sp. C41 TaxID=2806021 RepID=UPI001933C09E|nr:anti-sigma factor [Altererythrobacter sp. C41]MBM0171198.1 anti-sigma factor [Altererythrobacter sp. C41]
MTVTREELAAFADGELTGERAARVAAAVAADPALAGEVEAHRALRARLADHYAPVAAAPVPDRLAALLTRPREAEVVDFAEAKERRETRRTIPRWGWIVGPALAASLALVLLLPGSGGNGAGYADPQLAAVLDSRLVAEQVPGADTRVLLSFRAQGGEFCRVFSGEGGGGIACRDGDGWRLEALGEGSAGAATDYRMAGASDADLLARAQDMAQGPALDAEAEAEAKANGWR